jgi:hypothetical protein
MKPMNLVELSYLSTLSFTALRTSSPSFVPQPIFRQTIRAASAPPTTAKREDESVLEPALAALEVVAPPEEVELGAVVLLELALPASPMTPPPTLAGETELAAFAAAERYPFRDLSVALLFCVSLVGNNCEHGEGLDGMFMVVRNCKVKFPCRSEEEKRKERMMAQRWIYGYLRWVDHANHACLAMAWYRAVEPNGIGVLDGYGE